MKNAKGHLKDNAHCAFQDPGKPFSALSLKKRKVTIIFWAFCTKFSKKMGHKISSTLPRALLPLQYVLNSIKLLPILNPCAE